MIQDPIAILAYLAGVVGLVDPPSLAPAGLLLAVLGNVLGTYLGLRVAQAFSGLGS